MDASQPGSADPRRAAGRAGRGSRHREATVSELRIARRLAEGNEEATSLILTEYGGVLAGYLRHLLGDQHAAEDVLQQVMIQAWQQGRSYDPSRGSPLSWLMTIARSRALDSLRRKQPEPRDPTIAREILDRVAHVEDHAEQIASQFQLGYLLARLPTEEAQMLRMRFQQGLSQQEISNQTGTALGTVKTRMITALKRLRDLTEDEQ